MAEIGSYYVSIKAETGSLAGQIRNAVNQGMNQAGANAASQGESIGKKLSSGLGKAMKLGVGAAATATAGLIGTALTKGFSRLNAIDQAEAKLKGLKNSAADVEAIMKNAGEAVKGTAFSMGDAATVAAQMAGAGIKPGKQMVDTLKLVADSATIGGATLGEMGSVWGKVAAKGKLDGEVLAQLMDRGIGLLPQIAKEYKVTGDEAMKMVSEGKISFEDFSKIMQKTLGGAALESGNTFKGAMDNAGAALGRLGEQILSGPFKMAPGLLSGFITGVDGVTAKVKTFMSTLESDGLSGALEKTFGAETANKIMGAWNQLSNWFQGIKDRWAKIGETLGQAFQTALPGIKDLGLTIGTVLGGVAKTAIEALTKAAEILAPIIRDQIAPAFTTLMGFLSEHKETIAKIVVGFLAFKTADAAIGGTVGKVTALKNALSGLGGVSGIASKIAPGITALKAGFTSLGGVTGIVGSVRQAVFTLGNTTPILRLRLALMSVGGVSGILGKLKVAILAVGNALKAAIMSNPIIAGIAAIALALTLFFTKTEVGKKLWDKIWSGIKIAFAAALDFIRPAIDWLKGAWAGISESISSFWASAWPIIKQFGETVWNIYTTYIKVVFEALKLGFSLVAVALYGAWVGIIKPLFEGLGTVISWVWTNIIQPAWEGMKLGFQILGTVLGFIWNSIIKPIWDALGAAVSFVWNSVIQPVWEAMKLGFQVVGQIFGFIWNSVIKPAWDALGAGIAFVWNSIIRPAWDALKAALNAVGTAFQFIWNSIIKPAWDALGAGIRFVIDTIVKPAFDGLKNALKSVGDFFGNVVNGIKTVWNGLIDILKKPINFLINSVWNSGVLNVWRSAAKFLPITDPPGNIPALATGGAIHGAGTATSDSIPALLSNGEHVFTAAEVRALGGQQAVYQLRNLIRSGGGKKLKFLMDRMRAMNPAQDGVRGDIGGLLTSNGLPAFAGGGALEIDRTKKQEDPIWMKKIDDAHAFAKSKNGNPYTWGNEDCSGYMSMIADKILGGPGQRRWATSSFPGGQPFVPGLGPGFSIGIKDDPGGPGGGHTAGTLGATNNNPAVNVESGGSHGNVAYGGPAVGADHAQFTGPPGDGKWHLEIGADGDFVAGGNGGMSAADKLDFVKKKIKELFDSVMKPIRDAISGQIGDPPPAIKEIPHKALKDIPDKLIEKLFDMASNLNDLLGGVFEKAKKVTDFLVPSFLRDSGGPLPTGTSLVQNNTGSHEFVLTMKQFKAAQDILAGVGRIDLAKNLDQYVGKTDDDSSATINSFGKSVADWAINDVASFFGIGSNHVFRDMTKSVPGLLADYAINPSKYAKDNKEGTSDKDIVSGAVTDATQNPTTPSTTGLTDTSTGLSEVQMVNTKSKVEAPSVNDTDPGGSGAERWRPLMKSMLEAFSQPLTNLDLGMRRLNQESGGDPEIVNGWDSNASAGTPSVGLMQVIGPTYQANKDPRFDKAPYKFNVSTNPAANIAASIKYTLGRYGDLQSGWGRAGGYRWGGLVQGAGTGISDSIQAWLSNGEYVMPAAQTAQYRPVLDAMRSGSLDMIRQTTGVNIPTTAVTDGPSSPLVHIDQMITSDPRTAVQEQERFAKRAARSVGMFGGR